jgi:ABC-type transporter Mla MlaB component
MGKNQEKGYQIATSKGGEGLMLTISGDLTLNNISGLKTDLSAHLSKNNNIKIVVKDADNIDLGFIQLIQSFVWTTKKNNNQIDVELNLSPDQQKLLGNSGIKLKF